MKKTLVALMALSGVAAAASYSDFTAYDVASTINAADFTSNAVTIALTLDVDTVKGYFQETDGGHLLVDVIGNNDIGFGTLVKNQTEYFSGSWNQLVDYAMTGSNTDMGAATLWKDAVMASAVFSADRTTGARVVFTLAYEDGSTWQTVGTASGVKSSSWDPTGELTVDTAAVKTLATYGSYISEDDAKSIGGALVPEPTTATLSLLALAGLAARRRRK